MGPFPSMGLPSASTTRPRRASPTGTSTWAGQYFGRGHGKNRTYNLSGTLDGLAFLDQSVRTEKHHTNLAGFQVHAHALDTRGEPAIPLVSVVACWSMWLRVLDKLLGLDVAHAVNTGNTVTVPLSTSVPLNMRWRCGLPDGKHTSSLGETVLLLDATDPLLEDRGHLGRGGLCFGGIGSDGVGEGRGAGLVWWGTWSVRGRRLGRGELPPPHLPSAAACIHRPSNEFHCGANGIQRRLLEPTAMARRAAGARAGGCDGLTDAILPVAEIAATRRLDWRMALENIAAVLKRLF